jgi:hypothetical protein
MSPKDLGVPAPVSEKDGYVLHPDLLNPNLLEAQYAVRGELYLKAEELKKSRDIIYTNGEPARGHCSSVEMAAWLKCAFKQLTDHDAGFDSCGYYTCSVLTREVQSENAPLLRLSVLQWATPRRWVPSR